MPSLHYIRLQVWLFTLFSLTVFLLFDRSTALYAQTVEYDWNICHDFDRDFNGRLTFKVGTQSTTTPVHCVAKGDVRLSNGKAVFKNKGYVACTVNLARAWAANYPTLPPLPAQEQYKRLIVSAEVKLNTRGNAPLLLHPDANYLLNAGSLNRLEMSTIFNGAPAIKASFARLRWSSLQSYRYEYACALPNQLGCQMTFQAGNQSKAVNPAGNPVQFRTGETIYSIGGDATQASGSLTGELPRLCAGSSIRPSANASFEPTLQAAAEEAPEAWLEEEMNEEMNTEENLDEESTTTPDENDEQLVLQEMKVSLFLPMIYAGSSVRPSLVSDQTEAQTETGLTEIKLIE